MSKSAKDPFAIGTAKKAVCGCCEMSFRVENLFSRITKSTVLKKRKFWGHQASADLLARASFSSLYNLVPLCAFCEQYFREEVVDKPDRERTASVATAAKAAAAVAEAAAAAATQGVSFGIEILGFAACSLQLAPTCSLQLAAWGLNLESDPPPLPSPNSSA